MRSPHHERHHDGRGERGDGPRRGAGRSERGEPGFGRGMGFGPGGRGRPGGRTRRGDIRIVLLSALTDGPGHGYELIQRIEQRTDGRWRPSPGSVYPTLQMLEDAEHVTSSQQGDKKVYSITEAGQMELQKLVEQSGMPPWVADGDPSGHGDFRKAVGGLIQATKQVAMAGTPEQLTAVTAILDEARRKVYKLLAES